MRLKYTLLDLIIWVLIRSTNYLFVTERRTSQLGKIPTTFIKINVSIRFRNHEHRKLYNNNSPISLTFKKHAIEPVARARVRYILRYCHLSLPPTIKKNIFIIF